MSNLRNGHVALSNLRVKGHYTRPLMACFWMGDSMYWVMGLAMVACIQMACNIAFSGPNPSVLMNK